MRFLGLWQNQPFFASFFFKTTLKQDKIAKNQAGSVPYISPRQFFKIIQICTFKLKGFTSIQSILNAKLGQHRFFID